MIKTSNYKEIKQLAIKSSLRSLTHTYTELKDGNSRLRVRRADHLNMFQRSSYQKKNNKTRITVILLSYNFLARI